MSAPGVDDDQVILLDDYRPCTPEERLQAIVELAASGLEGGPDLAQAVLIALAAALADLRPDMEVKP